MKRPNIVLILSDQLRLDAIRGYGGSPDVSTPHLDRLMNTGTSFRKSRSLTALRRARAEGRLIISEMVLAEISPALKGNSVGEFLADWELEFEPCGLDAAVHAGECFSRYISRGGKRGRIVADLLVAAHAQLHGDRLLARDDGFKRDYFGDLPLLCPE